MTEPTLKRSLTLVPLTVYGVGTIVGGGFYALVGKVAGLSGSLAPWAFLLAATVALFSAFSFAELSARFPASAGESRYVQEAFGRRGFSQLVGVLVIATGVVSAATLSVAMTGFLEDLTGLDETLGTFLVVGVLAAVVAWGITQSVLLVGAITLLEVGTLLAIVVARRDVLAELPERWSELAPAGTAAEGAGLLAATFLAFYAYIGFEDMVNVAEEVKRPERTLPRAILLTLVITTLLYALAATVAVLAVPPAELAAATTPMARIADSRSEAVTGGVVVVSLLAGANGALVQILMAARVVYGMSKEGRAPRLLGVVNPRTRTPVRATAGVSLIVLALAVAFPLVTLARVTSAIILVVFAVVNVALIAIKRRGPAPVEGAPSYPMLFPVAGALLSSGLIATQLVRLLG